MPIYASWGFIWIFHSSNFLENNASLTLLILGTFSKTGTFETVRSHQVQELVIKKYRKEDKNFEAPERARAGAFKSIKWYKEQSGLSRQRYGLIPKWHFDIFQGRWKLK